MKSRSKISLNALKTFEAVARHNNMSNASIELGVTPGAVSRQISELQSVVSFNLFSGPRTNRVLTDESRQLAATLTSALDEIDATLLALDETRDTILDVACLSTMAVRWLIPRLHRFRSEHPNIDLRLSTSPRSPDRLRNRIDVSISVLPPTASLRPQDTVLFAESLGPVLKPGLLCHCSGPDDLSSLPLLTTKTRPQAWQEWQAQLGSRPIQLTNQNEFEHLSLAIEAAANGLGVCVTPEHLVESDIGSGRLIAPFGFQQSGYVYVAQAHGRRKRRSDAFIDWLSHDLMTS
ncbi:LysR substrate-binding domain-containing protein [Primorskyibacter aestuariivivens]|uniref:LysR substrate-binding domain-containing protein n=1 Tax=Primorskyibacter aestuariivivens TaxID=1888912 RepID=UPI002301A366|nr:LysR substrate-binding domain-containing protein [Primorskyibacter aestuariivivens]MDA7429113.1 LysR substrate-binding domain-containing protein [Primorskyibacter aestuariivivens]